MHYPPNHDERMEVLNATTASLGWGRDTTMTMLEKRCKLALEMALPMLQGKKPLTTGIDRKSNV